jgi:ribonucleoside-diphosphate reductase alpha chain
MPKITRRQHSRFPGTDEIAEIFLNVGRAGSDADALARDSAVVASIALQFGAPVDVIRKSLMRDPRGVASSPLGIALDLIAEQKP